MWKIEKKKKTGQHNQNKIHTHHKQLANANSKWKSNSIKMARGGTKKREIMPDFFLTEIGNLL